LCGRPKLTEIHADKKDVSRLIGITDFTSVSDRIVAKSKALKRLSKI